MFDVQFQPAGFAVRTGTGTQGAARAIETLHTNLYRQLWTKTGESFRTSRTSSRRPSGRHNRRHNMSSTGGIALVLSFMLLGTSAGWTQSAPEQSMQCDSAVKSKPTNPSLLGRSEMQAPKPLPAIRALRFAQIPVAACPEDSHEDIVDIRGASISSKSGDQRAEQVELAPSKQNEQAPAGQ